ncbi:MAG: hypothetical protein HYX90_10390 [Chloroflexi bacterium]|nr:hypothetical protein [Chloroflexota bacterium]
MDKIRQSKDRLRQEKQRIIGEMRKVDLEIAKNNLSEDNGEKLSWDGNDTKEENLEKFKRWLEEIQRELGDCDLA